MTANQLPEDPSLENLKKQAKSLLKSVRAKEPAALARIQQFFGDPDAFGLQDAQLVVARHYGFASWTRLKRHVEARTSGKARSLEQLANDFLDLVCLSYGGSEPASPARFERALALLEAHPPIGRENIYTASAIGDLRMLRHWLDSDPAQVNQKGGIFGWEPLMYAAYARLPGRSTLEAGRLLIERGADPNAHYMWGGQYKFTALTGVFGQGEAGSVNLPEHPDCVAFARLLLDAGANPNDSQAAYNRLFEPDDTCLELLIEYGLDGRQKNNWMVHENDKLVPNPSETMHYQLILAIRRGLPKRAKLLIDHGADFNKPDDTYDTATKGMTPYQTALMMGDKETAEYLRAKGAAAGPFSEEEGFRVTLMAGDAQKARDMLEANPDLESKVAPLQQEMLKDAVTAGNASGLGLMIDLGFDINDATERTPLHEAALLGKLGLVKLLLARGADPTLREPNYFATPMGFALHNHQDHIVAFLDDYPMDIFQAAMRGKLGELQRLLDENPDYLNMRFADIRPAKEKPCAGDWATPLVFAVYGDRPEAVAFLLERGADATINDGGGKSLRSLAEEHAGERVKELIAAALGV